MSKRIRTEVNMAEETSEQFRVRVALTPALTVFIKECNKKGSDELSSLEWEQLQNALKVGGCTYSDLRLCSRLLESKNHESSSLIDLLKGSSGLRFPAKEKLKPNPEAAKRRKELLARQEQREYARMCRNVAGDIYEGMDIKRNKMRNRQTARQLSMGTSMILMIVASFAAGYMITSSQGFDQSLSLIVGLCFGIIMLFVEMILFVIRTTREEQFEQNRKEFFKHQRNISGIPSK
mmetsp:Transcript_8152/g.9347  ORF Transcript_8152/g.9347 Transcript_8152/m.9347 type:complete len:235 (+) Transcript_8152:607-1311(+)